MKTQTIIDILISIALIAIIVATFLIIAKDTSDTLTIGEFVCKRSNFAEETICLNSQFHGNEQTCFNCTELKKIMEIEVAE